MTRPHSYLPRESGMSISMVVLALVIVAMIMLYVGTQTLNSLYTTRKKSDRSVGMAAGDSGIEKVRLALQAGLMHETDGYTLSLQDLQKLIDGQAGATIVSNASTSDAAGMSPVRLADPNARYTVREAGTDTIGYWQVYAVVPPHYLGTQSDLTVYVRAWATAPNSAKIVTQPRIFRVEYRPSFFSDYQMVSDAPVFVKDNPLWTIDGPLHSNGYPGQDFLTSPVPGGPTKTGIWFDKAPTCNGRGAFSTSQGAAITVPGASCSSQKSKATKNARQLSLLGAEASFRQIEQRCGLAMVRCFDGQASSFKVKLGYESVKVNGTKIPLVQSGADSKSLTILLDADATVSGALSMGPATAGRLTIALRRRNASDRQPQVQLLGPGVVGAAAPTKDTVGIVAQGDVVLPLPPSCISAANLAVLSESGSVTVPPEFVTLAPPAVKLGGRECSTVTFTGSFSTHGTFLSSIKWPDVRTGGSTPSVGYRTVALHYNRNLFLNPPPFFPTALPWAVTNVKDADTSCLAQSVGEPTCT
ncbi:MAG: hypothetical protein KDC46_07510 [Thermoleophilia bacterium]|nr:hypothetical protein [Thermoleophilia bacterium]